MDGKWEVLSIEDAYESQWTKLQVAEVELPDKSKIQYDVISALPENGSAALIATVAGRGTLLLWRHRFVTDDWTWELPGGHIETNETPHKAATREFQEETGWLPGKAEKLISFQPFNGRIDARCHGFITNTATHEGPDRDTNEASDIAWLSIAEIDALIEKGDISSGQTLALLLYAMRKGLLLN